ncbi:replication-relaxation family protein [Aquisalibacillus elongatus]|uniref:Protein involved in plasmid replication-relaxation n=1 Tax=Aquisalibacillus elongatus TaxID=485577 RepID=A0A3N5BHH3_9BACI|nr:replication-relaxation family protein [Aquisalibacillus elongatus]RPF57033.1 protein involved in plasmid replication-relaxation [Aquisalibacillus elongatus]
MNLTETDHFEKLDKKRLSILEDLVRYRALTTTQIKQRYFGGKGYHINNVLLGLRKKGYIKSRILKGSREGKKGYSYHRITNKGIELLLDHGKELNVIDVKDLYLRPTQLKYVLVANDIMMMLSNYGWKANDSRDVKQKYKIDRRSNILGELESPDGKQFGFYVFEHNSDMRTIARIQSELKSNLGKIKNYLFFTKGQQSFEKFLQYGHKTNLATGNDLKLISLKMGVELLSKFPTEQSWVDKLAEIYGFKVLSMDIPDDEEHQSFPILIEYKGETMYLADMSYSDLSLTRKLNTYLNSGYRWEKRRVFVTYMMDKSIELIGEDARTITHEQQISIEDYNEIKGE